MFEAVGDSGARRRVKAWVEEILAVGEGVTVMVTELRCLEPGCPPIETVIALLEAGGRRQWKVHTAASSLTREAVIELVTPSH